MRTYWISSRNVIVVLRSPQVPSRWEQFTVWLKNIPIVNRFVNKF